MNEQTTKLIEQLALKLGTTTEYLWSVLIKQAYVSGVKSIVFIVLVALLQFALYKLYRHGGKALDEGSDYEEGIMVGRTISLIAIVILCFFIFLDISNMMTAFLNPEFWALDYILDSVKQ